VALLMSALAGCAVGPNFETPPEPPANGYVKVKAAVDPLKVLPKGGQQLVAVDDIAADWWKVFRSKSLERLVHRAIEQNPSLDAADAAIRVAHYNVQAQRGLFLPQVAFSGGPSVQQTSNFVPSPAGEQQKYVLHTQQVAVSFTPDLWGGNIRAVENLEAQKEQQFYQLQAAYLTLTSNVVTAAIQEASLRGQIAAVRRIVVIERNLLNILKTQYELGQVARADVLAQEAALAQAEQLLPPLERQLGLQRDLLTALAGQYSADEVEERFSLPDLKLPSHLPILVPSRLVERRPDIRASAANWHAASAQVGVALAARLPNITLSGSGGSSAFRFAQLFTEGTGFYTIAATATQTVFDGMSLYNRQKAAEASVAQAEANYRATVIAAFQNVADTLRAIEADARALRSAIAAERAARASLDIVQEQLNLGQVNQLAVLNAQQTYLNASVARVQAEAARLADTAALFMALGGGWPDRCDADDWKSCLF
jgi:NodT family efflux transporter outer membrane factor (OMF) lipoprotein